MAISMQFTNFSQTSFQRGYWGSNLPAVLGSLDQSPGPTLQAESGLQSMSAGEIGSSAVTVGYSIYCTWIDSTTNFRFGVQLYVPVQVIDIGTAPYWYVSYDNEGTNGGAPNWILPGDNPSIPYTWPVGTYNIAATPTADHSSLSVGIVISPPA
ncbi:MAG TPA: hypothetical protein VLX28_07520 [Thermoanaerobaculia bacterium]|nr:hypothetical protein [Thermoanaerobaculia bacterium]